MNRKLTALTLSGLFLASLADAAVTLQEKSSQVAEAAGLRRLVVENPRGSIHVRPSADGRLHVSAVKTCRAESDERARRYALETSVRAGRDGNDFAIRVTYPKKIEIRVSFWDLFKDEYWNDGGLMPRVGVQLVLDVPSGLPVEVTSISGDVDSEAMPGPQTIRTTSGDVNVRGASGPVDATTTSGDIEMSGMVRVTVSTSSGDVFLNGASAAVSAHTTSGDITVNGAGDSLRLRTSSGDVQIDDSSRALEVGTASGEIRIRSAAGAVNVRSTSGGIRMRLRGPLRTASLESVSGEIQVDLAEGMDAAVEVKSRNGEVDSRLALAQLQTGRGELSGRLGRGGPPLRIQTSNGDITLTGGGK